MRPPGASTILRQPDHKDCLTRRWHGPGWAYVFLVWALLLVGGSVAHAQCKPNDKVYIDPRLVPPASRFTPQQVINVLTNPSADPTLKEYILQQYRRQTNPIEMPYSGGKVLINPQNPCIQQFIPNQ